MGLFDSITNLFSKTKGTDELLNAFKNGKLDVNSLKDQLSTGQLEQVQKMADQNGDGKVDLSDLKDLNLQDTIANGLKDTLGNLGDDILKKK